MRSRVTFEGQGYTTPMHPRLILFDVDGTLIDSAGAGRAAIERAFEGIFGLSRFDSRAAQVPFAGMTDPIIMRDLALAAGISTERFARAIPALERSYLEELAAVLARPDPRRRLIPGVDALLEHLAARPWITLSLLTGNLEAGARLKLAAFDLNRYFPDGGFSSDHADRREIARHAWRRASQRAATEFDRTAVVVVGDTEHDIDCARANGFRAVAVHTGWVDRESLERAGPDALLDGFEDTQAALEALGVI
jgi:phosphoglycolate phosphatase-like HAD superfamily hydrolase